jgi:hypothetical protein
MDSELHDISKKQEILNRDQGLGSTRAEPLSFRAIKDLAPPKKTIIKIAL